jgi:hypothetical protein
MTDTIHVLSLKNLVVVIVLISNTLAAQDVKTDSIKPSLHSNALFCCTGVSKSILNTTFYYERMIQRNAQRTNKVTLVKAGFGEIGYWDDGISRYILGQFGILTGVNKHHMELNVGLVKFLDDVDLFPISGSIGYRIQKPGGHFLFRVGLGWPEAFNFGWGVSF